mmetsp:Transcript_18500/g.55520  ORF Transcript_18500/g.55520 Transcript_18500/m.55520 type:complete len:222 (+) Transcript_18500:282-947(+)
MQSECRIAQQCDLLTGARRQIGDHGRGDVARLCHRLGRELLGGGLEVKGGATAQRGAHRRQEIQTRMPGELALRGLGRRGGGDGSGSLLSGGRRQRGVDPGHDGEQEAREPAQAVATHHGTAALQGQLLGEQVRVRIGEHELAHARLGGGGGHRSHGTALAFVDRRSTRLVARVRAAEQEGGPRTHRIHELGESFAGGTQSQSGLGRRPRGKSGGTVGARL